MIVIIGDHHRIYQKVLSNTYLINIYCLNLKFVHCVVIVVGSSLIKVVDSSRSSISMIMYIVIIILKLSFIIILSILLVL